MCVCLFVRAHSYLALSHIGIALLFDVFAVYDQCRTSSISKIAFIGWGVWTHGTRAPLPTAKQLEIKEHPLDEW